ncbi:hypothetical protein PMIN07_004660 [Paraphaeosphaeria minitans]
MGVARGGDVWSEASALEIGGDVMSMHTHVAISSPPLPSPPLPVPVPVPVRYLDSPHPNLRLKHPRRPAFPCLLIRLLLLLLFLRRVEQRWWPRGGRRRPSHTVGIFS